MTIQQVKKELGLIDKDIAEFFQYANSNSYATSARKEKLDHGIIKMFLKCKEHFDSKGEYNKLEGILIENGYSKNNERYEGKARVLTFEKL